MLFLKVQLCLKRQILLKNLSLYMMNRLAWEANKSGSIYTLFFLSMLGVTLGFQYIADLRATTVAFHNSVILMLCFPCTNSEILMPCFCLLVSIILSHYLRHLQPKQRILE